MLSANKNEAAENEVDSCQWHDGKLRFRVVFSNYLHHKRVTLISWNYGSNYCRW